MVSCYLYLHIIFLCKNDNKVTNISYYTGDLFCKQKEKMKDISIQKFSAKFTFKIFLALKGKPTCSFSSKYSQGEHPCQVFNNLSFIKLPVNAGISLLDESQFYLQVHWKYRWMTEGTINQKLFNHSHLEIPVIFNCCTNDWLL